MNNNFFIYPTDTVWGLGAPLHSQLGHMRVREIKKHLVGKPLSLLFCNLDQLLAFLVPIADPLQSWLSVFFTLETTLLIPLKMFKEIPPSWVVQDSQYMGVRVLHLPWIIELLTRVGPITSTSLNITGEAPIVDFSSVKKFIDENQLSDGEIITEDNLALSGHASTIIKMQEGAIFETIRKGQRFQDVQKQLNLFPTRLL